MEVFHEIVPKKKIAIAINQVPGAPKNFPNVSVATVFPLIPSNAEPVLRSINPDERITIAVVEQTTSVSKNTPKIPHNPCFTGSFVSETEWSITEEPSPASFENTPLLKP